MQSRCLVECLVRECGKSGILGRRKPSKISYGFDFQLLASYEYQNLKYPSRVLFILYWLYLTWTMASFGSDLDFFWLSLALVCKSAGSKYLVKYGGNKVQKESAYIANWLNETSDSIVWTLEYHIVVQIFLKIHDKPTLTLSNQEWESLLM